MTVPTFQAMLRARPFMPFRVIMSNGESYPVPNQEAALPTVDALVVGTEIDQADGLPTGFKICSLSQIAEIEPLEAAGSSSD